MFQTSRITERATVVTPETLFLPKNVSPNVLAEEPSPCYFHCISILIRLFFKVLEHIAKLYELYIVASLCFSRISKTAF